MDFLGVLQEITRQTMDTMQLTDLQIGTVVNAPPNGDLEIKISEAMDTLKKRCFT